MKKLLALLLALAMVACLFAGCAKDAEKPSDEKPSEQPSDTKGNEEPSSEPTGETYKIAMITDYGDITDQSFNQTTYEA